MRILIIGECLMGFSLLCSMKILSCLMGFSLFCGMKILRELISFFLKFVFFCGFNLNIWFVKIKLDFIKKIYCDGKYLLKFIFFYWIIDFYFSNFF